MTSCRPPRRLRGPCGQRQRHTDAARGRSCWAGLECGGCVELMHELVVASLTRGGADGKEFAMRSRPKYLAKHGQHGTAFAHRRVGVTADGERGCSLRAIA